jgi:hypothetical protein
MLCRFAAFRAESLWLFVRRILTSVSIYDLPFTIYQK